MQNYSIMRYVWRVFRWEKDLPTCKHQRRLTNLGRDGYDSHFSEQRACAIIHGGGLYGCSILESNTPKHFSIRTSLENPFFAGGSSWQCISLVIHQGRDPLYGDHQPAEHFYVLEREGPKKQVSVL